MNRRRCKWCNPNNPLSILYHDQEWGKQCLQDRYLYEMLILESFQAGLSWECVLNKRAHFRTAFDGFDPNKVASYDQAKIDMLCHDPGIIRNRRKILASVENSKIFLSIVSEFGTFSAYLQTFTGGNILYETGNTTNFLSDAISRDLQNRGMKFVGSVILYSYLQAIGCIVSHDPDCYLHAPAPQDSLVPR